MRILSRKFDVSIIGAGPAGMSAALWCSDLGLKAVLIERERDFGGQLTSIYNPIKNYLGIEARDGREMQHSFVTSLADSNFERVFDIAVEGLDPDTKTITMSDGSKFESRAIVLATGVRRRTLEIAGEREFQGRGLLFSGVGGRLEATGKTVVIVGGGDAALENASILSEVASKVIVVHRGSELSARREFVDEAGSRDNVEFLMGSSVTSINGQEKLRDVTVRTGSTESIVPSDLVLIRIGVIPNSQLVAGIVERDGNGYIQVDAYGQTSVPGIFAVGDVANPKSPTISTAAGTAATAVKSISLHPIK